MELQIPLPGYVIKELVPNPSAALSSIFTSWILRAVHGRGKVFWVHYGSVGKSTSSGGPGSVPSTHTTAQKILRLQSQGIQCRIQASGAQHAHGAQIYM